ncbi:hypothetical protein JCM14036_06820 [Desulfotomaculum defluvii]
MMAKGLGKHRKITPLPEKVAMPGPAVDFPPQKCNLSDKQNQGKIPGSLIIKETKTK